jgi:hypothetical protein
MKPEFEKQAKAGFNSKGHYQFASNAYIGCKKDRPMNEQGIWCDACINYQKNKTV